MDTITEETKWYIVEQIVSLEDEKYRKYIRNYLRAHINIILKAIYYNDYRTYEHYGSYSIMVYNVLKERNLLLPRKGNR